MRLLVSDLAALMACPCTLVLDAGMPVPTMPWPAWRASPHGADWLLHPEGAAAEPGPDLPTVPRLLELHAAPAGIMAVMAQAAPVWLALWPAEAPPLLRDAAGLAALLAARLQAEQARSGGLRDALLVLRAEHEETRAALAHWLRSAGQGTPQAPVSVLAEAPDAAIARPAGRSRLQRALPLRLDGLTAVAVHLRAAECGPGSTLRLRVTGIESERIAAAWTVPGEALCPGWLRLDWPMPALPWRESMGIEVTIDLAAGDRLALSGTEDAEFAVQVFRAVGAPRFVQAAHWDGALHGLPLPPAGVRVAVPDGLSARHQMLAPGEAREIMLPGLPVAGLDMLHARLRLLGGSGVQAALSCDGAATGWWDFDPQGELTLPLRLPVRAAAAVQLRLALRQLGPGGCGVEWLGLTGSRG